jgi:hypothetical protein
MSVTDISASIASRKRNGQNHKIRTEMKCSVKGIDSRGIE